MSINFFLPNLVEITKYVRFPAKNIKLTKNIPPNRLYSDIPINPASYNKLGP